MTTQTAPLAIAGVAGTLYTGTYANGRRQQYWESKGRAYRNYYLRGARIHAVIRFDNELGNARSSFSLTASLSNVPERDQGSIGCAHDDIAAAFPELAHLVRWHMAGTDGPWGYIANTVYLAGDRDSGGRRWGEPWAWHDAIRFGDVPALHRIPGNLAAFLRSLADYDREGQRAALVPIAVAGPEKGGFMKGNYSPKYQFSGDDVRRWAECPFDTEQEAEAFAASFVECGATLERIPHLFSEGKARELDAARNAAVWPDASDEELSVEPDVLRERLAERLPGIMAAFRADIDAAGLEWPEGAVWGER